MKKIYTRLMFVFIGLIIGSLLTGLFLYKFIESQKKPGLP